MKQINEAKNNGSSDNITAYDQGAVTHNYSTSGVYTINITGQDIRLLEIFNYVHQFFNIIAFILAAIGLLIYNYIDGKVTAPEVSVYWN